MSLFLLRVILSPLPLYLAIDPFTLGCFPIAAIVFFSSFAQPLSPRCCPTLFSLVIAAIGLAVNLSASFTLLVAINCYLTAFVIPFPPALPLAGFTVACKPVSFILAVFVKFTDGLFGLASSA
jgi:hypothetical protein